MDSSNLSRSSSEPRNDPRRGPLIDLPLSTNEPIGVPVSKVESPSGDHLKIGPNNERVVESDVPARQGVTGHNVRIVLFVSVVAAAVALAAVYAFVIR